MSKCIHGVPESKAWGYYELTVKNCPYCEIDRLKAEIAEAKEMLAYQKTDYEFLLSEAKADVERLTNAATQMNGNFNKLSGMFDELVEHRKTIGTLVTPREALAAARQEVAREIIQYIEDQGIIGSGWNYHQVYEIDRSNIVELKQRFGLEG